MKWNLLGCAMLWFHSIIFSVFELNFFYFDFCSCMANKLKFHLVSTTPTTTTKPQRQQFYNGVQIYIFALFWFMVFRSFAELNRKKTLCTIWCDHVYIFKSIKLNALTYARPKGEKSNTLICYHVTRRGTRKNWNISLCLRYVRM